MEFIQQNIYLVAIAVISGTMLAVMSFRRPGDGSSLTATQATLLINREDAHIVDIRETGEYAGGHLPNAKNYPLSKLADHAAELEKLKGRPLIVCCASGMRSNKACGELKKLGFDKLYNLSLIHISEPTRPY